ncbi:hypothetical protein CAEBREN_08243 [Caenorhabditis brenneri]|uniref:F-box domain-containing protein n=1 Tax=Caenorhabditis brenneri TaxID=135651 RepID=G0N518_CAEBE|nr:hypothetical protein CAEBREN_08243 [Caenorhabditis brenneri]
MAEEELAEEPVNRASLIGIPPELFAKILENCEFDSIFSLRKVCHSLRDYLLVNKPSIQFTYIHLVERGSRMILHLHTVSTVRRIDNLPWTQFKSDVKLILDHADSKVKSFGVYLVRDRQPRNRMSSQLLKFLGSYLESRREKLQIEMFTTDNTKTFIPILSNVQGNLNDITFICIKLPPASSNEGRRVTRGMIREDKTWNLVHFPLELSRLPAWNQAHTFDTGFGEAIITTSVMLFLHFNLLNCGFLKITEEEVSAVAQAFIQNQQKVFYWLKIDNFANREEIVNVFGEESHFDAEGTLWWYFRTVHENRWLRVIIEGGCIRLDQIFDLPPGSIVRDFN